MDDTWSLGTKLCVQCDVLLRHAEIEHYKNLCTKCAATQIDRFTIDDVIYVASPYSHQEQRVMTLRYDQVALFVAKLMRNGHAVFSPIVHCHHIGIMHCLPTDFAFWQRYCFSMLAKADVLWVLQMDGWSESVGVQAEIEFARQRAIPIVHEIDIDELLTGIA